MALPPLESPLSSQIPTTPLPFFSSTTTAGTSLTTVQTVQPLVTDQAADAVTSSRASELVGELVSHVSEAFLSSTELAVREDAADNTVDQGQRRQLLIGVICLSIVLLLVLSAVGYFFYRVIKKLLH